MRELAQKYDRRSDVGVYIDPHGNLRVETRLSNVYLIELARGPRDLIEGVVAREYSSGRVECIAALNLRWAPWFMLGRDNVRWRLCIVKTRARLRVALRSAAGGGWREADRLP
jgi:hypothetical protein